MAQNANKIRISLDVTTEMKEEIDVLANKTGTTQAEVIRRAIALLKFAKKVEEKGQSLGVVEDDKIKALLVGF